MLVQESSKHFIATLCSSKPNEQLKSKLNFISIGSKFKRQLEQLLEKLRSNVRLEKNKNQNTGIKFSSYIGIKFHSLYQNKQ